MPSGAALRCAIQARRSRWMTLRRLLTCYKGSEGLAVTSVRLSRTFVTLCAHTYPARPPSNHHLAPETAMEGGILRGCSQLSVSLDEITGDASEIKYSSPTSNTTSVGQLRGGCREK